MKTFDILAHPDRYFLVQYTPDSQGYMQPVGVFPFLEHTSASRPNEPFVSPKGSKYGLRKMVAATHWAIVYSHQDVTKLLHHGSLESISRKKRMIPFNHGTTHNLIIRGSDTYIKMIVVRNSSGSSSHSVQKETS